MEHGGDLADAIRAQGGCMSDWLDLSTGINPHPWPIPDRLRYGDWTRLPSEADLAALIEVARLAYGVPDHLDVVAAPGTQALIQWLPRLAPPAAVTILGPTYAEHGRAWSQAGRVVREVGDVDAAGASGHLVVVNPNNPDGRVVPPAALRSWLDRSDGDGWLVVDESFADVVPSASIIPQAGGASVVVLRSFGKFFGLAGLRLGFAIASQDIAEKIGRALGPWAVSAPALAVGRAALSDGAWAADMRSRLAREADNLDAVLAAAGARAVGGTSLYRLVEVEDSEDVHRRLARARIWVRKFAGRAGLLRFGLSPDRAGLMRLATALRPPAPGDEGRSPTT